MKTHQQYQWNQDDVTMAVSRNEFVPYFQPKINLSAPSRQTKVRDIMANLAGRLPSDPLIVRPWMAAISVVKRIGNIATQAMMIAWIAFMTQPAPFAILVLGVIIELGGSLLRMLSLRVRIIVLLLVMCSVTIGLVFQLAVSSRKSPV